MSHEAFPLPPPATTESSQFECEPEAKSHAAVRPRTCAWAELLKRVLLVDPLFCDRCGARMRITAAINPPEAVRKMLDCLGLPSKGPADLGA